MSDTLNVGGFIGTGNLGEVQKDEECVVSPGTGSLRVGCKGFAKKSLSGDCSNRRRIYLFDGIRRWSKIWRKIESGGIGIQRTRD